MFATNEATTRYRGRFPAFRDAGSIAPFSAWRFRASASARIWAATDDATDRAYIEALIAAGESGINFFDTAINYRESAERALHRRRAAEACSGMKSWSAPRPAFSRRAPFPQSLRPEDVAGRMHSMAPDFLADQIERSLTNLNIETIDVFYLHNPETQLGFVIACGIRRAHPARIRADWKAGGSKRRSAGMAPRRGKGSARRRVESAASGRNRGRGGRRGTPFPLHPTSIQSGMVEAFVERPESVLAAAGAAGNRGGGQRHADAGAGAFAHAR